MNIVGTFNSVNKYIIAVEFGAVVVAFRTTTTSFTTFLVYFSVKF